FRTGLVVRPPRRCSRSPGQARCRQRPPRRLHGGVAVEGYRRAYAVRRVAFASTVCHGRPSREAKRPMQAAMAIGASGSERLRRRSPIIAAGAAAVLLAVVLASVLILPPSQVLGESTLPA